MSKLEDQRILMRQRLGENIGICAMNCLRKCSKVTRIARSSLARCSMSRRVTIGSQLGAIILMDPIMKMKSDISMSIVYYLN